MTKQNQTAELKKGIIRGEKAFTDINIRKPLVPDLKGVNLMDLFQLNADAWRIVLPRISTPKLVKSDFETMSVMDLTTLMNAGIELISESDENDEDAGEEVK
ncbi:hypothetical protein A1D22_09420 [Pasteurellaceae bacterium LFhippo2]|nr:hypothetical protein [Pasteurellaceae bacterium LFhippo2]